MKWFEIRQTSSIEYYQKFLIHNPSTNHLPEIIDSLRLFWERKTMLDHHSVCHGNCINLFINKNGRLLFEGSLIDTKILKDTLKYWLKNPDNLEILPAKGIVKIQGLGDFEVSKGIVDIRSDAALNPEKYTAILKIVLGSFADLRNEYAIKIFNKEYDGLNAENKARINMIVPIKIDFERFTIKPGIIPRPQEYEDDNIELEVEV